MYRVWLLVSVFCLGATGCTVNEVIVAEESDLIVADEPVEESKLLDVGIVEFAPGLEEDNDARETGIYEEIRLAETKYLAYHLKTTLQGTGHWGAVRVIPSREAFTDVIISGQIEKSDGEFVVLDITVEDAAGRHWFDKSYEMQTGVTSRYIQRPVCLRVATATEAAAADAPGFGAQILRGYVTAGLRRTPRCR
ncbi:MAG: hypothetical protein P8Y01_01585 [Woeseiaceae bacterium]